MLNGGVSVTSLAAIFECRILASGFAKITIEYCHREANGAAHELAKI